MSLQIEENITKILKNQNSKKVIEAKLTNNKLKNNKQLINKDRSQLNSMLFQVVKENIVTDHVFFFPCAFQLLDETRVPKQQRRSRQLPKPGSFIRTIKMDFDMQNFNLVIYDYQYLGGEGSIAPTNGAKPNWNSQYINQIVRKNNTVKGGQILLDSYANDKTITEPFLYPKVQFLSVKVLERLFEESNRQVNLNVQKIVVPKDKEEDMEIKNIQSNEQKIEDQQF